MLCEILFLPRSILFWSLLSLTPPQYLSAAPASGSLAPAISVTDNVLKHLNKMRSERNQDLCLRIGVKQGGCSGMSYTMDFEDRVNKRPDDSIIEYEGFEIGMIHILFLIINIYNSQALATSIHSMQFYRLICQDCECTSPYKP